MDANRLRERERATIARGLVALALTTLVAPTVRAATACYDEPCSATCQPGPPAEIATLVEPGDFPPGVSTPVAFVDPGDGRDRRLIATQEGVVLSWDSQQREMLPSTFLDLRDDIGGPVFSDSERGLLALAMAPDFATSGELFVLYTAAEAGPGDLGDVVVERYLRSESDPDLADVGTAKALLVVDQPSISIHNGGWLAFGSDGFLYVSTGDGTPRCDGDLGSAGDAQRSDSLAGKILRLDVQGRDPMAGPPDDCGATPGDYGVPSSNPYFGQEPACDEVWALGLRNPFRFSFDRQTGDLFVGDVGQDRWEEIDLKAAATPAPVNFGWVCREGCESAGNPDSGCATPGCPVDTGTSCQFPRAAGHWDPILCHHNPGWVSVIAGYRYRGRRVPSLTGDYLYGDAGCGQIWKTDVLDSASPATASASCWASGFAGTYGFAEDAAGELYVVVGGAGRIDCIHNGSGCFWVADSIFGDGFESGGLGNWSATSNSPPLPVPVRIASSPRD